MLRRIGLRVTEDRVNGVPRHVSTVLIVRNIISPGFRKGRRRRGQEPIRGVMDIYIGCSILKVIDVSCSYRSYVIGVSRYKMCKLRIDREGGRCSSSDPRYFIDGIGEPLHLRFPTSVNAPDCVGQGLITCVDFCCERPFTQVHNSSAEYEVF